MPMRNIARYFFGTLIGPDHFWWAKFAGSFAEAFVCFTLLASVTSCGSNMNSISAEKAGSSDSATVSKSDSNSTKAQDTVNLTGENFSTSRGLRARVPLKDGTTHDVMLSVKSRTSASFVMPENAAVGLKDITILQGTTKQVGTLSLMVNSDANKIPIIIAEQDTICSNIDYIDGNSGAQKTGTKDCSCKAEGQTGCLTTANLVPVSATNLVAGNIKSGVTLAGVTGNFAGVFSNCTSNGQQSCIAAGTYYAGTVCGADGSACYLPTYSTPGSQFKKAIDYSTLDATKMLTTLT
ncbi:MAG: hypothetical protein WCO71_09040, partial [Pseudomonadota bacterium]